MKFKHNLFAFITIGILGGIWHFVYEWTNCNLYAGLFFPINESCWEHLKLLFFPTLIYSVFEYFLVEKGTTNYISAVVISVNFGMLAIISLFYTYFGFLGKNIDFLNIAIYYIALILMLLAKNKILHSKNFLSKGSIIFSIILAILNIVLFVVFSLNPPNISAFIPPTV